MNPESNTKVLFEVTESANQNNDVLHAENLALNKPQNSVDKSFNGLQRHHKRQARVAMDEFLNTHPPSVEDICGPEEKKQRVEAHMHYFAKALLFAQDNAKFMAAWNNRMTDIINKTDLILESELDVALKNLDLANRNLKSALMTLRTAAAQQDKAMTEM